MSILYRISTCVLLCMSAIVDAGYPWAVIGAGPAGIISIATLIDNGVAPADIVWIDPEFKVGRLGKYYGNVPSNHQGHQFTTFLQRSELFKQVQTASVEAVCLADQFIEHRLQLIINPLQDITDYIRARVTSYQGQVQQLLQDDAQWNILTDSSPIVADKVILATGSSPKRFSYEGPEEIPLDIALDEYKLKDLISHGDTVLLVGSAHSALLILKYLSEFPVKKIINVYTMLPSYVRNRALSGITAWWTQEVLEKNPPSNVVRVKYHEGVIEKHLGECNKIVYAFGYQRTPVMVNGSIDYECDQRTGIIARHLYGIGIAFPRIDIAPNGEVTRLVGVNAFTNYAQELVPLWLKQ